MELQQMHLKNSLTGPNLLTIHEVIPVITNIQHKYIRALTS